jgi:hypothetical protein
VNCNLAFSAPSSLTFEAELFDLSKQFSQYATHLTTIHPFFSSSASGNEHKLQDGKPQFKQIYFVSLKHETHAPFAAIFTFSNVYLRMLNPNFRAKINYNNV